MAECRELLDFNVTDNDGCTPLHLLVTPYNSHFNKATIPMLVAGGIKVNTQNVDGNTALYLAAKMPHNSGTAYPPILCTLLDLKSDIHLQNKNGDTALHVALKKSLSACIFGRYTPTPKSGEYLLVERGSKCDIACKKGITPIQIAALCEFDGLLIKMLGRAGNQLNLKALVPKAVCEKDYLQIETNQSDRQSKCNDCRHQLVGLTVTQIYILRQNKNMVEKLLRRGASVNQASADGDTALHLASWPAEHRCINQRRLDFEQDQGLEMMKLLVTHKADINTKNNSGKTPLHVVTEAGNLKKFEYLLLQNADVNIQDNDGNNVLCVAIIKTLADIVRLLLSNNAEVKMKNKLGQTPLHLAVEYGNKDILSMLLATSASVNAQDRNGQTPLHVAARRNDITAMKQIVKARSNVDVVE